MPCSDVVIFDRAEERVRAIWRRHVRSGKARALLLERQVTLSAEYDAMVAAEGSCRLGDSIWAEVPQGVRHVEATAH